MNISLTSKDIWKTSMSSVISDKMKDGKTLAILAAYNLEDSIADIVKETEDYVDEVVVVSDGSNDKTNEIAREAGAECPPHSLTRGKGFAVRKGIKFSRKFNPDYIVLMDADGQHLPEEIPKMIEPIKNGDHDAVIGSRVKGELKTSTLNKIGNFFLKIISFFVTGKWFTDTESGFRAFDAEKLYKLDLNSKEYEIESELLLKSLYNDYDLTEVPITVPKAVPGVTFYDGLKMGIYKLKLGWRLKFGA